MCYEGRGDHWSPAGNNIFTYKHGRGGACSSRLPQNNIFENLIDFYRRPKVAPTGFYVVVLFVVYISFFAGGASPSPTKIEKNLIFVDSRFIRTNPPINQNLCAASMGFLANTYVLKCFAFWCSEWHGLIFSLSSRAESNGNAMTRRRGIPQSVAGQFAYHQTRRQIKIWKPDLIIVVCRNKSHMHKYRCSPAGASPPAKSKFEIKPHHRGVWKQILSVQISIIARRGFSARGVPTKIWTVI